MELTQPQMTVSLPFEHFLEGVNNSLTEEERQRVRLVLWKLQDGDEPVGVGAAELDMVVLPFHTTTRETTWQYVSTHDLAAILASATRARLVQAPSIGIEGLVPCIPERAVLANAVGVMERPTAELAATLLLTVLREIPEFIRSGAAWDNHAVPGLIGKRVLLLGYGGVGSNVERMLAGFGPEIVRVASRERTLEDGRVIHGIDSLVELAADCDAVVCTLPLNDHTRGLLGAEVLAALPEGAALVNIGRGPVLDTEALLATLETKRLRVALDVTDPEPLPAEHPLWHREEVLITPHVGGNSDAALAFQYALIVNQMRTLLGGGEPVNIVAGTWPPR